MGATLYLESAPFRMGSFQQMIYELEALLTLSCTCQGQVLVYKGPLLDTPGELVRVAVAWDDSPLSQGKGALLPWDVQWCDHH